VKKKDDNCDVKSDILYTNTSTKKWSLLLSDESRAENKMLFRVWLFSVWSKLLPNDSNGTYRDILKDEFNAHRLSYIW